MFTSMSFRSLIHLEFIFIYGIRECCSTILLHVAVQFFQQHLIEEGVSSILYSGLLFHRWGDHNYVGLSLGFLSFSIDLYFCFCASTVQSWPL